MAEFKLKGNIFNTEGDLPSVGADAISVALVKNDLSDLELATLKGQRVVLNVFPSIDTDVCAASVRYFNAQAGSLDNTTVVCVSMDLPFAQARFCGAEGLDKVITASDFRYGAFGRAYGNRIADGPLAGLLARSVIVVNEDGDVIYTELCRETTEEPNYDAALAVLK